MSSQVGDGTESVLAPAGWYPDSSGVPRWWDGHAWDMAQRGSGQERTWALLSHLSFFVLFLFSAIVLRVAVGRRDPFTRHHTTEALNAQIWFFVVWNALWIPLFLTSGDGAEPPAWAWLGPLFGFVAFLATAGLAIRGAVQAGRGIWWRYPVPFRFVPGSVPRSYRPASLPT
jgi:uncharacterized Tic20 family protein